APAGAETVKAPMPGKILSVDVKEGQAVKAGDLLCVLEAMKMANEIYAPSDGTVKSILVAANATVQAGDDLIALG
ncbi:acetyl-CoA carboxylase biotin carboxyl carrier protein subunit, partial [Negativicoccus succinicivorans]